jgi:large subunit ribosomal protein L18
MATSQRTMARKRRQIRVRRGVRGSAAVPRLCVFRSNKHMYAQVISDESGQTLVSASTLKLDGGKPGNREAARKIGEMIAALCKEKNIERVVFDRNGFLFHGRVKEVAEGARAAGLKF